MNLEIENCSENLNVKILDLTGKIIYSDIYQAESVKKINLENFANGIYFLEISNSKNEKLKTFKIQKS
ncbi:MAG: T9SS type A sorting domain-containing protein [Crocinitomicaceae bacterium]|nr:T9SS type A sorting domain-containing protein [Crocinitomicaceae bacterium]